MGRQTFRAFIREGWGWLAGLIIVLSVAQTCAADVQLADTNLIPEDVQLWTESMLWDKEISVYSGVGYNNNVLLSSTNQPGSAFSENGVDLSVIRLPLDGWQIVGSIIGYDIRFWDDKGVDRYDNFIGDLQVERELPMGWVLGLEGRGLYDHEIVNISYYDAAGTGLLNGFAVTALPYVRKNFDCGLWLKAEFSGTRWMLDAPLDYYWDYGPKGTVGYDFGKRADVAISYGVSYQHHQTIDADDDVGNPIPGQLLEIFEQKAEVVWHEYWDDGRHWRTTVRLTYESRTDNGGGYLNQDLYGATGQLRWQTSDWKIQGGAQIAYQPFSVQLSSIHAVAGNFLYITMLDFSLEAERRIYKGLKCYAKVDYQRSISNEELDHDDYNATVVSGGLRYEF